jgi:tRNA nucleotidyltransferase (CCA-adding enzyme)
MAKITGSSEDIFVDVTQDYLRVFGRDLLSLVLYGSAAGGAYVKGKSDINLLVVLTPDGIGAWKTRLRW